MTVLWDVLCTHIHTEREGEKASGGFYLNSVDLLRMKFADWLVVAMDLHHSMT